MNLKSLKLILVSTPIGYIGSGKGGGVELTLISLIKGLTSLGHQITLIAPEGSTITSDLSNISIKYVSGLDQPSWQHQDQLAPIQIPYDGLLPKLWEVAINESKYADAILNFSYDWLPIWLTPYLKEKVFHLISMGAVSKVMKKVVKDISDRYPYRFAFHTQRQADDYELSHKPYIVGNGFDLNDYKFKEKGGGPLGWVGRVSPEKGLEDAFKVAASLGENLLVWGFMEDLNYAAYVQDLIPDKKIEFRGFLETKTLQNELGNCRALINTPKWNEAYGNVVVEAMACGVPVVTYDIGGPGEIISSAKNGWLVRPNDIDGLKKAILRIGEIDRKECRKWVEKFASKEVFAKKIEEWIIEGVSEKKF